MRKGSKMTEEQRKRLSIAHLGQKAWNKGIKLPRMSGSKHPNWKGGKSITNTGYIRIQHFGNSILEHRLVMEKHLGRKLNNNEVVHHINGNKKDNRIKNLKLFTSNSDHIKAHRWSFGGKEEIICRLCSKKFINFKSNKRIFCSKSCYIKHQKGDKNG